MTPSVSSPPPEKEVEHHQGTRNMWVPKLNYKEDERTVISKERNQKKEGNNTDKSKGVVTLPYVKGVTEPVQWIVKHQEIATSVRPHQDITGLLVHPKDKVEDSKKTDCIPNPL